MKTEKRERVGKLYVIKRGKSERERGNKERERSAEVESYSIVCVSVGGRDSV